MPAQLDFKAIAEGVDIKAVAQHLGITLSKDGRATCPACNSKDRALEIIAETNTFRCWAADKPPGKQCLAGDVIGLVAHVQGYQGMYRAAKELAEAFGVGGAVQVPSTSPTNRKERATAPPAQQKAPEKAATKPPSFDPAAFAAKLEYTSEVEALGISQDDAQALGIGFYRGKLYQALRWPNGYTAGYSWLVNGELKLPPKLLPPLGAKILRMEKRA